MSIAEAKQLLRQWRESPLAFVREALHADPTRQQTELLEAVKVPGAHVSVASGHGTGKSAVLAWLVLWHVACFENSKTPCTAPSAHQLKDVLWSEIALWHRKMYPWLREQILVGADRVTVAGAEDTQWAVSRTARRETPDALQGFHAEHLLFVIDEAAGVAEAIFAVAGGALSTKGARVVMTANPTRTSGYFYDSHHKARDAWTRLHFSCLDSPLVDESYPRQMAEKYGTDSDEYRVRVLGQFPSASPNQLISRDLAEDAIAREVSIADISHAPCVLGIDPAGFGGDRSVVAWRQGLASGIPFAHSHRDAGALAACAAQQWQERRAVMCCVDMGWGGAVSTHLRHLGYEPIEVAFGGKPLDARRFDDKRTEMWVLLKEWLEQGGCLPNIPDLVADLTGPEYGFASSGKLRLESKDSMKKRRLPSPDLGDALALTFAYPAPTGARAVQAAMHNSQPERRRQKRTREAYNPLAGVI